MDEGHFLIVATQDGLTGHIAGGTIGISGDHQELMATTGQIEFDLLRKNLDAGGPIGGDLLEVGTFGDPLAQGLVVARTGYQRLTPLVGNICQGFLQHEGFIDMDTIESSSAQVVDQCLVIVFWIVAAQRQFEAVFPLG